MATPAKIEANQKNARRSTGPRSVAGKRRSSQNATSHGIYCRDLVLPGESQAEFRAYRDAFLLRLSPQDVLELLIVDRIVGASWKLKRLQAAEPFIHGAEAEVMPGHHARIHFHFAVAVQNRSGAGIEQRIVLEHRHGSGHGVERRASPRQQGAAFAGGSVDARARLLVERFVPFTRAAVHSNRPSQGCAFSRLRLTDGL